MDKYVKHAQKFGTEGVMETARDDGLTLKELGQLLVKIDAIETKNWKAAHKYGSPPKRKKTVEQRVKQLCGINDEEEASA